VSVAHWIVADVLLGRWQAIASSAVWGQENVPNIVWVPNSKEKFSYEGRSHSVPQLAKVMELIVEEIVRCRDALLEHLPEAVRSLLVLPPEIHDDIGNRDGNYFFGVDPENGFKRDALFKLMCQSKYYFPDGEHPHVERCEAWLRRYWEMVLAEACGFWLNGGGLPRGTEFLSVAFANTLAKLRNIWWMNGQLASQIRYNKAQSQTGE
jgi:hypothetical protein